MSRINFLKGSILFFVSVLLTACQAPDFSSIAPNFSNLKVVPASLLNIGKRSEMTENESVKDLSREVPVPLQDILDGSLASKNPGSNFIASVKYALELDPEIISKRRVVEAKLAAVGVNKAQRNFQVGTTLYGGIEDVTDNTRGLAVAINASRLVFDGGELDSDITSSVFEVEAAKMDLAATIDNRAYELLHKYP